jgi:uncharacterized YccA/Bax inhibitor family protein
MQSNNPIFRNSKEFNGQANAYGNQTYPGNGSAYQGYGQPPAYGGGTGTTDYSPTHTTTGEAMTIDSVVQRTALTLFVVLAAAAVTWVMTGDIDQSNATSLLGAMTIGSLGAFALSMVNSFKRVISPALVIAFAAFEGVALGAFSKFIDQLDAVQNFGNGHHIVVQAVIGTFAAFGGTLAAYKFFDIKVGQKFRTFVIAAVFGMVGLSVLEMVLSLFNAQLGLFGFGGIGLVFAVIGLALGVFMLILDFDFVERGIAAGLPERESWRAAFGLTVSLVWIYTNLLRILAILNQD